MGAVPRGTRLILARFRRGIPESAMARRAYWSGHIRLSLVAVPVQVIPATNAAAKISFHQVHKPSGSRIRYQKVVPGKGPVDTEDIVKGYEIQNGKYVLVSDEEINKIKLEAKKTIDLVQFVDVDEIDPIYFDRPFFVLPDEDSDAEAYVVLREALRKTKKAGLGQIVIRGKASLVALKACGKGLMLEALRYADELKGTGTVFKEVPALKPEADMIELAEQIIKRKSKPFDASDFENVYEKALHELIEAKAEHRQVREIEEAQQGAKVIDLMEALRRSVGSKGGGSVARRGTKSASRRKSGGRTKSARRTKSGGRRKAA
jgi:DNA end-binding protein Ku